jgi:hypothetical protein
LERATRERAEAHRAAAGSGEVARDEHKLKEGGNGSQQAGRRQCPQGRGEEANAAEDEARRCHRMDQAQQKELAVKKPAKKTMAAKKFKGVRREKA